MPVHVYPLRVSNKRSIINYTYLVINDDGEALMIDPGWEFDTLTSYLKNTKCTLRGILLTHHHADHTQLAPEFVDVFDVPVFMSGIESDFYNFKCLNLQPILPDQLFLVAGFEIFAFHTPGHTKGSVCFKIENYLFTGDTLFIEGCGMCHGAGADPIDMYNSIQKIKNSISPLVKIYPGHSFGEKPGAPFNYVLAQNIYFHIHEINKFVAFRMRKNQKRLFDFK